MVAEVVGLIVLAVAFVVFGHWARRHVDWMLPGTLSRDGREQKRRQYRRGATTCQVVGVLALVLAISKANGWVP